jgi:hypothetical protein
MKARRKAIETMPECDEQLTLFAGSVRDTPAATPHRPLSERERELLVRWCGTDNHPLIIDAINLFNATVVAVERSAGSLERMAVSLPVDRARTNFTNLRSR